MLGKNREYLLGFVFKYSLDFQVLYRIVFKEIGEDGF